MRDTNRHHLFWPKHWYKTELEIQFRELPCHIVELAIGFHNLLHRCSDLHPPRKPTVEEMLGAVHAHHLGKCPCSSRVGDSHKRRG